MTHLSDDDLVLLFYHEGDGLAEAQAHVGSCRGCGERFGALSAALRELDAAGVPERDESYGARVWAQLRPRLDEAGRERRWWRPMAEALTWPRMAMGSAIAALLVTAFVAGRSTVAPAPPMAPAAEPPRGEASSRAARERVLLAAVGSHLDRSRVLLTEIAHRDGGATADISPEQSVAADLVATGRLYRQAAVRNGDPAVASVLEDLERVLIEIASSPSPASRDDLVRWREQIDTKGLLFKVTVMGSRVRERQQDAASARAATKTST